MKLIYIDPPYNTGKDFVYPDKFQDNIKNYLELTGQIGEVGEKLSSNTEASGRFHTYWLNMMYPRLKLARNLLREDGVILVSIDDGEVHNLRNLLDLVFGMEAFVGSFVWEGGRKNDARLISLGHDYVLVYAKSVESLRANDAKWREKKAGLEAIYAKVDELRAINGNDYEAMHRAMLRWYRELPDEHPSKANEHFSYVDDRGIYFPDNLRSPNPRPNLVFEWKGYQPHPNGWAYGRERMAELDANDRLCYPESKEQRIKIKSYLHEHETWAPGSVFYKDRRSSSKALTALMGQQVFDFPKDIDVIARLIEAISSDNDLILDCFAGSGATGHATMDVNRRRNESRRYILVQLPEALAHDNKEQKAAASFCDELGRPRTIAELTKERLRRAAIKIREENSLFAGDLGFRVFKLASSNIRAWDPDRDKIAETLETSIEHLKTDRTEQDILFELLLKLGLDLCVPIKTQTVEGNAKQIHDLHSIGGGSLLVCLSKAIPQVDVELVALAFVSWHEELQPAGDTTVVFRDSAFADDVAKTNITSILQQHGLETVRSL